MSYQIHYAPEMSKHYPQVKKKVRIKWVKWCMLFLLFGGLIWVRVYGIPDLLVPGDPQITKTAAKAMLADLQNGETLEYAVNAFCREILDGAK